ncbi:POTRA domain-containing protein [Aurantibacter aestuarii]|uniref:Outer membrane protein assembly factor n=1 Tax=Aurantibacter aestuarii TaxID=1266046 RepID=A0A2T1NE08_9FLAO|nr:POTRA domain-containing protein [Aurantibacter aestuarii]PSG90685.1 outer membrane protein assembly factor [Aurantibacter aestuarii]
MHIGRIILILGLFCYSMVQAQESMIADVKIQGNKKLKTGFILKIAKVKPGAVLDSALIEEDIKRLKRLPSVSHAYYQVFYSQNNAYNVFYNIEENFTIIPSVNVYTSNNDEFAYRLGLYEFNFLGRNITLGGYYQKDNFSSYGLNFRAPYLFSRKAGIAINVQDLNTREPVFFDETTADYRYQNKSLEVLGLYEFNFKHSIAFGGSLFNENYSYITGATNTAIPQQLDIDKHALKFIYEYNNLDYNYQCVTGFKSIFNGQYVGVNGNSQLPEFFIGWNDFLYFKKLGVRGNWANRLRVGLSSNADSPFSPFAVDNNLNIRGVGNTIDRGTGAIVLNTEYRYTLLEKDWFVMQSNTFIDAGSWRNPGGEFGDFGDADNIRINPGLGLRFIHKSIFNAIFRIDYGFGITKNDASGFVFGIGQYF